MALARQRQGTHRTSWIASLFRKSVRPIGSQVGRQRLLWHRDHTPRLSTTITATEVEQAHREVNAVPWSNGGQGRTGDDPSGVVA